jgi:hypothetical protein
MNALKYIMKITDRKVDWIYEEWDLLVNKLDDENSYQRSIAIKLLCNLIKSDEEDRINKIINKLLRHTKDDKFITSRQCILNIWKVAIKSKQLCEKVMNHLEVRYKECIKEKHYNLLRQDIIQSIRHIYETNMDKRILLRGQKLIAIEKEGKYRKKYEAILNK